ncbi:MAG: slipin family protein [Deltaproteobacteria bacterium]|nr:slipin family protein [Deltaproteobacteria bacterium]
MAYFGTGTIVIIVIGIMIIWSAINVIPEYERGVVFFLGRYEAVKGPGLVLIFPGIQKMIKVSLRTIAMEVPSQDIITKDNVSVKVNAVVYMRAVAPAKAIINIENYVYATSQLAQTTLRSVCGQAELDELLSERDQINKKLQEILDKQSEPWGIKVSVVEIKQIDLPEEMKRAMAKQAEAEREKRAKIIHAEGEMMASEKILEASNILSQNPISIQLRYLQTLTEIAAEKNSTILFPLPMDLVTPFLKALNKGDGLNKTA